MPDSAASPLPSDDPAWEKAKADADAAYAKLKVNPELFDEMDEEEFSRRFGDKPLERPGLRGMRRNFHAALARQDRP